MIYRNYAGRWNQAGLRRPGGVWGARRPGYRPGVYRPGAYRWGANRRFGYRPGIYAGRRWPHVGVAPGRRWSWLAHPQRGFGYAPAFGVPQPAAPTVPDTPQAQALPPQWIQWAQSCLAQAVGPWVPQDGNIGKATRKAIGIFQAKQQLPPSGMLDAATVTALQAACSPQPAGPAAPAPPSGDDVAAASAAAAGGGAPPDAGAAPAPDAAAPADPSAGPPPDAPAGELFMHKMRSMRGRRRRRHHRQWGSGFNLQQPYQQQQSDDDGDDDSQELFMHGGWGRGRGWGGGGYQQPDNDGGNPWGRRRW